MIRSRGRVAEQEGAVDRLGERALATEGGQVPRPLVGVGADAMGPAHSGHFPAGNERLNSVSGLPAPFGPSRPVTRLGSRFGRRHPDRMLCWLISAIMPVTNGRATGRLADRQEPSAPFASRSNTPIRRLPEVSSRSPLRTCRSLM
jgi:hypothetical protein